MRTLLGVGCLLWLAAGCAREDGPESDRLDARLLGLSLSAPSVELFPAFESDVTAYAAEVSLVTSAVTVTATAADADATVTVQGQPIESGRPSPPIVLDLGSNAITVVVTASFGRQRTYVVEVERRTELVGSATYVKASNTGSNDRFGHAVAVSGDTLVVGAVQEDSGATGIDGNREDEGAMDGGAVYVFVRIGSAWRQQAYLKASNTRANDRFGESVAISGDTIVVGAPLEPSNATGVNGDPNNDFATDAGAAYVFVRSGGVWSQQAYLKASNSEAYERFGTAVAVSGDTAAIGAYAEDSNTTGVNGNQADNNALASGAVYVFVRAGGNWTQQAYLKASNTDEYDRFGCSVAVSGDTLVAGAKYEDSSATGVNGDQADNSAPESGAAYVFVRSGISWSQQAYLKAANTGSDDQFGVSVAVSGDTVAVGADMEDSSAEGGGGDPADNAKPDSGAVYVFARSGGVWSQQAYLKASNTGTSDHFGRSIAVWGDTILVGAEAEDSSATGVDEDARNDGADNSGAAYLFVRSGGAWSQRAYVKASNTAAGDRLGTVALTNGALAVGAPMEGSGATGVNGDQADDSAAESGAVYVFQ